jgi:hypothetical protein
MWDKKEYIGIKTALKEGLEIGTLFIMLISFIPFGILAILFLFADDILGIMILSPLLGYHSFYPTFLTSYASFPIALIIFGRRNTQNIIKGKSETQAALEFSFGVNFITGSVFIISRIFIFPTAYSYEWIIATIIIYILISTITTFTVAKYILNKTNKMLASQ